MIVALCASAASGHEAHMSVDSVGELNDTIGGYKMIAVPDSMIKLVNGVLSGKLITKRNPDIIDVDEKVIVRGDTVPLIIKQRNFGRYDRGLFNYLYIPKGDWFVGLTASYGEFSTTDYQLFDLLSDFNFNAHSFSIKPSVSYFIRNNVSLGLKFNYSNSKAILQSAAVDFDEDLNFNISDASYKNESYSAAMIFRQYIGLSRAGRFGVYNEVELAFGSGNAHFNRMYDSTPRTTSTTYMDARLNFSPGVCVFIMKNVAFNVSFGVFGYYLRNEKQSEDGVKTGNRFSSGANFRFNIFNIDFGIAVVV